MDCLVENVDNLVIIQFMESDLLASLRKAGEINSFSVNETLKPTFPYPVNKLGSLHQCKST